jgi:hypothetical protein
VSLHNAGRRIGMSGQYSNISIGLIPISWIPTVKLSWGYQTRVGTAPVAVNIHVVRTVSDWLVHAKTGKLMN